MYCTSCGKALPADSAYCPFCGAKQAEIPGQTAPSTGAAPASDPAPASGAAARDAGYAQPVNSSPIRKAQYNLLCILGFVISLISLVFNYFGLVGLGGIIVSVIGLVLCNRRRENGRILGVLGVFVGAVSVITAVLAML